MNAQSFNHKLSPARLARKAIVYLRQSSERQVQHNRESRHLQYALAERARSFGFTDVEVIAGDLGFSAAVGAAARIGFERLLAQVALGEVGIILSREVSRLSRTDKDWRQLLELCQLFDTLIADHEQIYDVSTIDDQLILGIKGTMSVVELKVLRMRMWQGMEEKARRGALIRMVPAGYVLDLDGKVVKDPDQRVREAIELIFRRFREAWSVQGTIKWFRRQRVQVPVNKPKVSGGYGITWQLSSASTMIAKPAASGNKVETKWKFRGNAFPLYFLFSFTRKFPSRYCVWGLVPSNPQNFLMDICGYQDQGSFR